MQKLPTDRIIILDGAFGTMAQQMRLPASDYAVDGQPCAGCNDALCLSRPDVVAEIHRAYLQAGADIITTNSFCSNAFSLADYGLQHRAADLAGAAARIARTVADEHTAKTGRPCWVAGSIGPTGHALSMPAQGADAPDFDAMLLAFKAQAQALIDGGVDLVLIETVFDTLNAKAAIAAVRQIDAEIPIIISGTISDASGRLLSGQDVEAFAISVMHANPLAISLNCGLGAQHLLPSMRALAQIAPCFTACYPNAGLPNLDGLYDETPEKMARDMEAYFQEGLLNIAGGCCGTTPAHIRAIAEAAKSYSPRRVPGPAECMMLSGLEPLVVTPEVNFVNVGERTNVAGSAKFAKLIREGDYAQAIEVARAQVDAGAQVIDVCMDAPMIDSAAAMDRFLSILGTEPAIAAVPVMIDSSYWPTIEAGLKRTQGKGIVNSISLKEGEAEFLRRARVVKEYGAALVVMLFDEDGQADTYERKIQVARRAYDLLLGIGFNPYDIIFDPNILAIATGVPEHDGYALAYIDATRWIKANLPGVKVSGGVSNLSFSFRGNNAVRKAMHAAFLYHAINAGMDMGIVNPQMVQLYTDIPADLLERVEDALLCRRPDAADRLAEIATQYIADKADAPVQAKVEEAPKTVEERIARAMLKGDGASIGAEALEAYAQRGSAIAVINDMLMPAMQQVGTLFGEGKMFLPQVVKSAQAMKAAVDALDPYITADSGTPRSAGTVVLATVKGDVHDIGKNIVGTVLACNGFKVIDLGVMSPADDILRAAVENNADAIGLSGLITPSLSEMAHVAALAERQGLQIPIIVGGATTSDLHTAAKIAPEYSAPVIRAKDAADTSRIVAALTSPQRADFVAENAKKQDALRESLAAEAKPEPKPMRSLRPKIQPCACCARPAAAPRWIDANLGIEEVAKHINWPAFFAAWGVKAAQGDELKAEAQSMLADWQKSGRLRLAGKACAYAAHAHGDDIILNLGDVATCSLPMLRSQDGRCAADYAGDGAEVTLFAVTAGLGLKEICQQYRAQGDDYHAIMAKLLADRLAEAYAVALLPGGCRVAFGYATAPDHSLKQIAVDLLGAKGMGISLTDNYMIDPAESVCGIWFPQGEFFNVGTLDADALADYSQRRGLSVEEIRRLMPTTF